MILNVYNAEEIIEIHLIVHVQKDFMMIHSMIIVNNVHVKNVFLNLNVLYVKIIFKFQIVHVTEDLMKIGVLLVK